MTQGAVWRAVMLDQYGVVDVGAKGVLNGAQVGAMSIGG
jgi:hypothetical protein